MENIILFIVSGLVLGTIFVWLASKKHKKDDDFLIDMNGSRKPEWQADDTFTPMWDIEGGLKKQEEK